MMVYTTSYTVIYLYYKPEYMIKTYSIYNLKSYTVTVVLSRMRHWQFMTFGLRLPTSKVNKNTIHTELNTRNASGYCATRSSKFGLGTVTASANCQWDPSLLVLRMEFLSTVTISMIITVT